MGEKEKVGVGSLVSPGNKPTPISDRERFDSGLSIQSMKVSAKLANGVVALVADAATTHCLAKHCDIVKLERNGMDEFGKIS